MIIRSFAGALIPPLLSLLLLLLRLPCSYGNQFINSCGDIHNITSPFEIIQGDPSHSDEYFTLYCDENNRTILNISSAKYYVQSINYTGHSIRLVDIGIQTNNVCSSYPLSTSNFFNYNTIPSPLYYAYYELDLKMTAVGFLRCENPIQFHFPYVNRTGSCITNGYYSYVVSGEISNWEVADFCILDRMVWSDSPQLISDRYLLDLSWSDLNRELAYGFEATWNFTSPSKNNSTPPYNNTFPLWPWIGMSCKKCKEVYFPYGDQICYGKYCKLPFLTIVWLQIYYYLPWPLLLSIIGGILGARFLLAPFVFGFLIIKFRRRHLSTFDSIESFLQGDNYLVLIRYSYSDIKKMTNGFRDKLGEGGFGTVYKGKLRSGPFVAIKVLSKPKASGQDFINEVATIGRIHHVNVVQLIGYCAESSKRALVYDFMPNGSLDKYIFSPNVELSLSCKQIFEISLGVARGIGYLHQGCDMQILHFDIKPHNILLDENFTPKVSDFGLAKLYPTDDSIVTMTAARGTFGYMAPELFYKNIGGVSHKADVYSFGMLLMEMAGRRRNWNSRSSVNSSQVFFPSWVYDQFIEGKDAQIRETTEEEGEMVKKMMLVGLWCIQTRPCDRPSSMSKVVEMLEGNIQSLHMPPKPFLYSEAMQGENGTRKNLSNLSGACMDSLTRDISGR